MSQPEVDIENLSPDERQALLEELWDSLHPSGLPLTPAQHGELDRRLDEMEVDSQGGILWEDVLLRIREQRD